MLLYPQHLKCFAGALMDARYALHSLALTDKGVISTDGHILLFMPYPDLDPEDAPLIEGLDVLCPPPDEPFLLDPKEAADAAKMLDFKLKDWQRQPWTEAIQAEIRGDQLVLVSTDLQSAKMFTLQRKQGAFPDVGRVIPDYSEAQKFTLQTDLLLRVAKLLGAAGRDEHVTLRVIDQETAIGFSTPEGIAMLQMPFGDENDHCKDAFAILRNAEREAPQLLAPAS